MSFNVTSKQGAITTAVNMFNEKYHEDYFKIRYLAKSYLATDTLATVSPLADALIDVLTSWGAGRRAAPSCQPVEVMVAALNSTAMRRDLADLEASIPHLAITASRRALNSGGPFASVVDFDKCLMRTLHSISINFFVFNTNVTYPMKSLLLLTGLMPAFDSQVKGGLAIAGVVGVNMTRYLMPEYGTTNAKKICSLPFYIADCVSHSLPLINRDVESSKYFKLVGEYGRIFDILLFMQKKLTKATAVVQFHPPLNINWYDI